jgi:hypothetical protein
LFYGKIIDEERVFRIISAEVLYLGYHRSPVITHKSGYGWFPPMASGWGTMHPILDMAPPLLDEEEGSPT